MATSEARGRAGLPALTTEKAARPEPSRAKIIGLVLGPVLGLLLFAVLPDSLGTGGRITAGVAVLMATWWASEAIPIPVTALLPMVLFPILLPEVGIADVAPSYGADVIFLFMGGFMLALAMQKWNLHKRMALGIVAAVGSSPVRLIGGFMLATGFITMWVSNTAAAIMMLPVGVSVVALVTQLRGGKKDANFATALMLGIAYSASIGSVATLIGTPPNALMVGFLAENYDITIGFGQWMMVGVPLAVVFLAVAWVVLTRFVFPPETKKLDGAQGLIREELKEMGPVTRGEKLVAAVFALAACSWIVIPLLARNETVAGAVPFLSSVSDSVIAIAVAVALFLIPVGNGERLLDWETAVRLPWGILLLFGGGIALSKQFGDTGLSEWIGVQVGVLDGVPTWVVVFVIAAMVLLLTELTSNTATTATFLPVVAGIALGMDLPVMTLVVPAVLAASMAFMLPVATPPNAVVFGSGEVSIGQMLRGGIWLNVIAVFMVMFTMYAFAGWAFGISL
ncbi:sodium-dependent dicarboxylate transporter 2/3/5 [Nocardiopsis sp. Huas11]|uniref:SLC13 family permease n=1 Tax=Nocardiopsis sp. Huas11 TaxID=2183912 RepID=UPI000EAF0EAE|nr:DASS family sodium-coupled anion symporter [Nocardiopsis sp. Huas11]RKS05936.1 sodium-dependent dicarboxylate transporter 2/3/5 [Nocardiopsis sp. Huas11]